MRRQADAYSLQHSPEAAMKKLTPFLVNGSPKTCWGCGQSFVIRERRAEAIVGADGRLYCHRTGCEETALISHIPQLQRPLAIARAA
jgi:hypothetical protein